MCRVVLLVGTILLATLFGIRCASAQTGPITVQTDKGPVAIYEDSEALIIANSTYSNADGWPPLNDIPRQAMFIREALERQQFRVKVVSNADYLTLSQTIRSFVVKKRSREARVLVYFAGHGWSDGDGGGYIVPVKSSASNDPNLTSGLVSMSEIVEWSYRSSAKHVLFVFDSCFSGLVFLTRSNLMPSTLYLADVDNDVRQFLTSGSADEEVPAGAAFAKAFVEGIQGAADLVPDGVIGADELGFWIKAQVARDGHQTPQFGSALNQKFRRGDFLFVPNFADNRRPPYMLSAVTTAADPGTGANRSAELRALGRPTDPRGERYKGVEIRYSLKFEDKGRVKAALDGAGVPYTVNSKHPRTYVSNVLVCGQGTAVQPIRDLAEVLIARGVAIYGITQWKTLPKAFIMIAGDNQSRFAKVRPLTIPDLSQFRECRGNFAKPLARD